MNHLSTQTYHTTVLSPLSCNGLAMQFYLTSKLRYLCFVKLLQRQMQTVKLMVCQVALGLLGSQGRQAECLDDSMIKVGAS